MQSKIVEVRMKRAAVTMGLWIVAALALGLIAALLHGCARVPASPTVPGRPATLYENVLAWNAAIANANQAATEGIINANRAGSLADAQTSAMLDQTFDVAKADRQLSLILQAGPDGIRAGRLTVESLLAQIRSSGAQLVMLGSLHIKNPQTQALVKLQLDAILTFAQNIAAAVVTLTARGNNGNSDYDLAAGVSDHVVSGAFDRGRDPHPIAV